ncbi:hypothetical protein Hanom_Chr16g01509531 [Helianthus anomalus]
MVSNDGGDTMAEVVDDDCIASGVHNSGGGGILFEPTSVPFSRSQVQARLRSGISRVYSVQSSSGSSRISAQNRDFGSNPVDSVNTRVNSGQQQVKRGQESTGRFQFRFAVRGSG